MSFISLDESTISIFPYMVFHEPSRIGETGKVIRDKWRVRYAEIVD
jgi:hypothetical protein